MRLNGIDYGPIWAGAGALGFFGEGYWFHQYLPSLKRITFVAKTVTREPNRGNMELVRNTWQPRQRFPDCIKFSFRKGIALNAVGLSNFGLEAALRSGRWQKREKPFLLSYMPIAHTRKGRNGETASYAARLRSALSEFNAPVALQVNLSCPNTGEDLKALEREAAEILGILGTIGIPLVPKFNVLTAPSTVKRLQEEAHIDAVCISNTIPYGTMPERIAWGEQFGTISPLAHLGGGGLSGAPLFQLLLEWVEEARKSHFSLPINAGGGIMHASEVHALYSAGADSISIATVMMLRPWRIASIIDAAYDRFA